MSYPDGHKRYRVIDDEDDEAVLDSFDTLFEAEQALTRALNEGVDAYLQDAEDFYG